MRILLESSRMIIVFALLLSCSSWNQKQSNYLMDNAIKASKTGDHYNALKYSVDALSYNNENKDAKDFATSNYRIAFENRMRDIISSLSIDSLSNSRKDLEELYQVQHKLKQYSIIQLDMYDFQKIIHENEIILSKKLIDHVRTLKNLNSIEAALELIEKYKQEKLDINDEFKAIINEIALIQIKNAKEEQLCKFVNNYYENCNDKTKKDLLNRLNYFAENAVQANHKRNAFDIYSIILEWDKNNIIIKDKYTLLKKQLSITLFVSDIGNCTDDFIKFEQDKIRIKIKSLVDNRTDLVEIMLEDNMIKNDLKSKCDDYENYYDCLKKQKGLSVKNENKINYLILTKISSFKINRTSPSMKTVSTDWDFSSDGNPIAIGFNMVEAYGSYKVQYFQYDEYIEKVNSKMGVNLLIYDLSQNNTIYEDKIIVQDEDVAIWAENPMAIGIVNKIPATFKPNKITSLMRNKHSAKSDQYLTDDMFDKAVKEIAIKVNQYLKQTTLIEANVKSIN